MLKQIGTSFNELIQNVLEGSDQDKKNKGGFNEIIAYNTEITGRFRKVEQRLFLKKQAEERGTL